MMDLQQHVMRVGLLDAVRRGLSEAPVLALLGARQVGKTTLAGEVASSWRGPTTVFDLEVAAVREALSQTPETTLREREGLVVVDEVQRLPALFETLRPICDDRSRRAVFLLLGSASWDLIQGVSETLAGRVQFVDVGGLALTETGVEHQDRLWMRGGFPRAWLAPSAAAWTRWMESFARTFLERDIPNLGLRAPPEALGRFWRMLAHYHGQVWNAAELARSLDVNPRQANRYRDFLAGAFMVRTVPPWVEMVGKRLVKSPKVYLRDSGVLHFLLGLEELAQLRLHPRYGASWEGFALEQTVADPRPTPSLLLRHAAWRGTGFAAAASRPALGLRVQVYGCPPHHQIHAHRCKGPGLEPPLGDLPGRSGIRPRRQHQCVAVEADRHDFFGVPKVRVAKDCGCLTVFANHPVRQASFVQGIY